MLLVNGLDSVRAVFRLVHIGRQNRAQLIEIMSHQGFVNYPTEWWHWSYGDRYWAYQTRQTNAIYATSEP